MHERANFMNHSSAGEQIL